MCWQTYKKEEMQPKVSENDVNVSKVVGIDKDGTLTSYWWDFTWELGKEYHSAMNIESLDVSYLAINTGFHSFNPQKTTFMVDSDTEREISFLYVYCNDNLKMHTWTFGIEYRYKFEKVAVMDCIIPKGSMYYENKDGEIVSDSLIPKEISLTVDINNSLRKTVLKKD